MTKKVTFLSMLFMYLVPLCAQGISMQAILGQWQYEYSQESIDDQWVDFTNKDLELVINADNEIFQEMEDSENAEPFLQPSNTGLLLKDALLIMKVYPANDGKDLIRFSFLQMPRGDEDFLYIDRSKGDLKGELSVDNNNTVLTLTNLGATEEYKIISMTDSNLVLLDMANNTKHLFKRKQ